MTKPFTRITEHVYYRSSWFQLCRPLTWTGTISPMLVGTLLVARINTVQLKPAILLMITTLLIQIATNIWNDYFDFQNGQDILKWQQKRQTKFQPAHHELPYIAGFLTFLAAILGLWLAALSTMWILPIGILGIVFGMYYSAGNPSLAAIGLGELIAAIFLGFATTLLPSIVLTQSINLHIMMIAVLFALLIGAMILTNNIRDIQKDEGFRHTIAMIIGRDKAIHLLVMMLISLYGWLLMLLFLQIIPPISVISIFAMPVAFRLLRCFKETATDQSCMKWVACHHWVFGLLLAISLLIERIIS